MASVKLFTIGSGNGLLPVQYQAITWASDDLLSTGSLETNFIEIWIKIGWFWFMQCICIRNFPLQNGGHFVQTSKCHGKKWPLKYREYTAPITEAFMNKIPIKLLQHLLIKKWYNFLSLVCNTLGDWLKTLLENYAQLKNTIWTLCHEKMFDVHFMFP